MTTLIVSPWASLDPAERRARLRALQALARVLAGPKAAGLVALLCQAEANVDHLAACDRALADLPTLTMRRVLATFAATLPAPE